MKGRGHKQPMHLIDDGLSRLLTGGFQKQGPG